MTTDDPLDITTVDASGKIERRLIAYRGITLLSPGNADAPLIQGFPRLILGQSEFEFSELHAEDLYVYVGTRFEFPGKNILIRCHRLIIVAAVGAAPATTDVVFSASAAPTAPEPPTARTGTVGYNAWYRSGSEMTYAKDGGPGDNGADGPSGKPAGSVTFFGLLHNRTDAKVTVAFEADGGNAGNGGRGGDGGKGGDGLQMEGATPPFRYPESDLYHPGKGGNGGNGGKPGFPSRGGFLQIYITPGSVNADCRKSKRGGLGATFGKPGLGGEAGVCGGWIETFPITHADDEFHPSGTRVWGSMGLEIPWHGPPENSGVSVEGYPQFSEAAFADTVHLNMIIQRLMFEWDWVLGLQMPYGSAGVAEREDIKHEFDARSAEFAETLHWVERTVAKIKEATGDKVESFLSYVKRYLEEHYKEQFWPEVQPLLTWFQDRVVQCWNGANDAQKARKEKMRQYCIDQLDLLQRKLSSQVVFDGMGIQSVPQPNISVVSVLESLKGLNNLLNQKMQLQYQLAKQQESRSKEGIERQQYVDIQVNCATKLADLAKRAADLKTTIATEIDDVKAAKKVAHDSLQRLYEEHRPSRLSNCSGLESVLSVVGNVLLFAHSEITFPFAVGSILQTGSAIISAKESSTSDIIGADGQKLISKEDLDSKYTVMQRELDTNGLLAGLQATDSAKLETAHERIIALQERFEMLVEEVFSQMGDAAAADIDRGRAALQDLADKADILNRSVIEVKQTQIEDARLRALHSLSENFIANLDQELAQTTDLVLDQAYIICASIVSLRTSQLVPQLINLIRAWNAATLSRCTIMDRYVALGCFEKIARNETFLTDSQYAMANDISLYTATFASNKLQDHTLPDFSYTPETDSEMIKEFVNSGKFNINYTTRMGKRFHVDSAFYDMRLSNFKLLIKGIKRKDSNANALINITVSLMGNIQVFHPDKQESFKFRIPNSTLTAVININDPDDKNDPHNPDTPSPVQYDDASTACNIFFKDSGGIDRTFDKQIRSPLANWKFEVADWTDQKQRYDFSQVTKIVLRIGVKARTKTVMLARAMREETVRTLDITPREEVHLFALDLGSPPEQPASIAPMDIAPAAFYGIRDPIFKFGSEAKKWLHGGRTGAVLPPNQSDIGRWALNPAVAVADMEKKTSSEILGINVQWHRATRLHLKEKFEADRHKVWFRNEEDRFGRTIGHATSVIAAHQMKGVGDIIKSGGIRLTAIKAWSQGGFLLDPERAKAMNAESSYAAKTDHIINYLQDIHAKEVQFNGSRGHQDMSGWTALLGNVAQVTLQDLGVETFPDGTVAWGWVAKTHDYYHPWHGKAPLTITWHPDNPEEYLASHATYGKNPSVMNDYLNHSTAQPVFLAHQQGIPFAWEAISTGQRVDDVLRKRATTEPEARNLQSRRAIFRSMDVATPVLVGVRAMATKYDPKDIPEPKLVVHLVEPDSNDIHPIEQIMKLEPDALEKGGEFPVDSGPPGLRGTEKVFAASAITTESYNILDDYAMQPIDESSRKAIEAEIAETIFQEQDDATVDGLRKKVENVVESHLPGANLKAETPESVLENLKIETLLRVQIESAIGSSLISAATVQEMKNNLSVETASLSNSLFNEGVHARVSGQISDKGGLVDSWSLRHIEEKAFPELENNAERLKTEAATLEKEVADGQADYIKTAAELNAARARNDKAAIEEAMKKVAEVEEKLERKKGAYKTAEELRDIAENSKERKKKQEENINKKRKERFPRGE